MREPLQSYLDGELTAARRAALAGHLQQCDRCAASLRRLAESDRLLIAFRPPAGALSPAASRALLDRALAKAGARRGGPGSGMPLLAWGFAVFLIIVASGVAAWWRHPSQRALGRP